MTPDLYGSEGMMNSTWLRYAQPIGRVLIRASLPVNTLSTGQKNLSGLGDMNMFATYVVTKPTSRNQFGFGPILTFPTATDPSLGGGKWQAGVALVAYMTPDPAFQFGLLATWQHSFAGNKERHKIHVGSIQPILMWQLGKGTYLRSTGIIVLDFENGNYFIPIGTGIGKVVEAGKVLFNIFIEPQFTAWHIGTTVPKTQLFVGINTQF